MSFLVRKTRFAEVLLLLLWNSCVGKLQVYSFPHDPMNTVHTAVSSKTTWRNEEHPFSIEQENECVLKVGGVHKASIPAGRTEVDYIKSYHVDTSSEEGIKECISWCCQLGGNHCQYAWLFTGKCFAIGCTEENAGQCRPVHVLSLSSSIYVALRHRPGREQAGNGGG